MQLKYKINDFTKIRNLISLVSKRKNEEKKFEFSNFIDENSSF